MSFFRPPRRQSGVQTSATAMGRAHVVLYQNQNKTHLWQKIEQGIEVIASKDTYCRSTACLWV